MKYMNKIKQKLIALANVQYGYFTSLQARKIGYKKNNFAYHLKNNNWTKIDRAFFRLHGFEDTLEADCVRWALWSRNKNDQPQAVISHNSALFFYKIINEEPERFHLTVPKSFKKSKIPEDIILYQEDLPLSYLENHGAFMTTNLFRTLKDTKEELEQQGTWQEIADNVYKHGKLTQEQLLQLEIISNLKPINTVTGYNADTGNSINTQVKDEVYYRAQDAQKIFDSMEKQGRWAMSASTYINKRSYEKGFTLVELLVVIAIISVLAGMLLPVLENATQHAYSVACANNQRQVGTGMLSYINEFNGFFPPFYDSSNSWGWGKIMVEAGTSPEADVDGGIYKCPLDEANFHLSGYLVGTYGYNHMYLGTSYIDEGWGTKFPTARLSQLSKPSQTLTIMDNRYGKVGSWEYYGFYIVNANDLGMYYPYARHYGSLNVLWADSHVSAAVTGDEANSYVGELDYGRGMYNKDPKNNWDRY